MAFVDVPEDLSKVKNKLIGNFTLRQILCFVIAASIGFPLYWFSKRYIGTEVAGVIMIIIMIPFVMFALYEKEGQPLEKILWYAIETRFIRNTDRPYETDNIYAAIHREKIVKQEVSIIVAKHRKEQKNKSQQQNRAKAGSKSKKRR